MLMQMTRLTSSLDEACVVLFTVEFRCYIYSAGLLGYTLHITASVLRIYSSLNVLYLATYEMDIRPTSHIDFTETYFGLPLPSCPAHPTALCMCPLIYALLYFWIFQVGQLFTVSAAANCHFLSDCHQSPEAVEPIFVTPLSSSFKGHCTSTLRQAYITSGTVLAEALVFKHSSIQQGNEQFRVTSAARNPRLSLLGIGNWPCLCPNAACCS